MSSHSIEPLIVQSGSQMVNVYLTTVNMAYFASSLKSSNTFASSNILNLYCISKSFSSTILSSIFLGVLANASTFSTPTHFGGGFGPKLGELAS